MNWVLPNIDLNEPVDGENSAPFPYSDPHVQELVEKYPKF